MERIVHILGIHGAHEATHGLHHHRDVGGLDGDHNVVEIPPAAHSEKLHCTLHHAGRSVAVAAHYTVGAVVHADADSRAVFSA